MNETIKEYFRYSDTNKEYHYRGYFAGRGMYCRRYDIIFIGMVCNRMEVKTRWRLELKTAKRHLESRSER